VRIAAVSVDEALAYLRWHDNDFHIGTVENLGLILLVSVRPSIEPNQYSGWL